jgi:hypothetical protein
MSLVILVYFYVLIMKTLPEMFHCPPFYLENYICDARGSMKICNNSQNSAACIVTPKMEAARPSEMLVSYHIATWYHNPEDNTHLHCLEALYKSA